MKTTIELPDPLAREAKALATAQGTSLRDLVVEGLRREVERRASRPRVDFAFPTVSGRGLRPDVRPERAIDASYGLPE